jgi:hypothetical protein
MPSLATPTIIVLVLVLVLDFRCPIATPTFSFGPPAALICKWHGLRLTEPPLRTINQASIGFWFPLRTQYNIMATPALDF